MQILFWSKTSVLCKSGICWPVEGMHYTLKYVSFFLPLTFSTESLRAILSRGWNISEPLVYQGFIATGVWIVVFLVTSLLVLKFRKGWNSETEILWMNPALMVEIVLMWIKKKWKGVCSTVIFTKFPVKCVSVY